jgi:hypothetical protein
VQSTSNASSVVGVRLPPLLLLFFLSEDAMATVSGLILIMGLLLVYTYMVSKRNAF